MMIDRAVNLECGIARITHELRRAALCGALLGLASCSPIARGGFAAKGYTSGYGYDVAYRAGTQFLLPTPWNIDNYRLDTGKWVRKDVAPYVTKYTFDDDDDGKIDKTLNTFTYALRYEHSVHSGVIWLRNLPTSGKLRSKDLRILMQGYINEITAATYETVRFAESTMPVVVEHRQAAVIVEEGPANVAGRPAYAATIDVADVDQIKLAPGARTRRVQLVLMRAPQDEKVEYEVDDINDKIKKKNNESEPPKKVINYPVIVLAGYSNMPMDFPAALSEFHDLLRRLTIDGRSGLTLNMVPADPPVAPSAPVQTSAPQATSATVPR
jgi:hypothetical protein